MKLFDPDLQEHDNDRVYLDRSGDLWFHDGHQWRYLTGDGVLTNWDLYDELPTAFGPYAELSPTASNVLRKKFGIRS